MTVLIVRDAVITKSQSLQPVLSFWSASGHVNDNADVDALGGEVVAVMSRRGLKGVFVGRAFVRAIMNGRLLLEGVGPLCGPLTTEAARFQAAIFGATIPHAPL